MAALGQVVSVTTSATLLFMVVDGPTYAQQGYTRAANPTIFTPGTANDPLPILLLFTTADTVYLGGSNVTSSSTHIGAAITGVPSLSYNCVGGDSLYGIVGTGTSAVQLLVLRQ